MSAAAGVGIAGGICHCNHGGLDFCDDVSGQTSSHVQAAAFFHFYSFATTNCSGTC